MTASRPPSRVLMTADAVGGVWTYCLDLARATQRHGFHYLLAVMGPPPDSSQLEAATRLLNVRIDCSPFSLEWMPDPWEEVEAAGNWLLELEHRYAPDIVHLNGYSHASRPFHAPKVVVGHSCCLTWWHALNDSSPPASFSQYRERVSRGIDAADAFVAPTRAMLAMYSRTYGPLPAPCVIYNGAPPITISNAHARKQPVVLCAGRAWDEAKNIQCVADAAPEIPWPIHLAGDLSGTSGTHRFTTSLGGLKVLGRLSHADMGAALAAASVYVHPAKYEPFGLLPLEAAQHHCALVLSDIPTLRELWDGAALFFDPASPSHLAHTVRTLISNPRFRSKMATLAHRRSLRYSLNRFGKAYARLYHDLLLATSRPNSSQPLNQPLTHTSR